MQVYFVKIKSKGINLVENPIEFNNLFPALYIEKVENFALGDINNYNTTIYLNALIHVIGESEEIPDNEKKNLIDKIKNIVNDPYVSGIGVGLIVKAIKTGV
ncbi:MULTISPECIES: hypothetical protein [Methanobacterium]|jgi:hypothetical protein|uniref:Uncharacterized protein n=1 Tax=Methanobacterium subterraneum TaxID=59277 RepID=A0A2H4VEZ1_9EURY|nr:MULTISPECIES: hypothetical protein [Methanobacterium]AUB56651.1 hypothetical protein BK007_11980 [Methanobacterium subterraneum]AUB58508.1 hypothetical protein BK008_09420 [Methanobacterium sp. MZ-A1]AUB59474.1 hypothetical protein BK009_01505 [Methanobacterium subterraneum]NMO09926.1 hypothetical protein [Methanobacterium subterraneum]